MEFYAIVHETDTGYMDGNYIVRNQDDLIKAYSMKDYWDNARPDHKHTLIISKTHTKITNDLCINNHHMGLNGFERDNVPERERKK